MLIEFRVANHRSIRDEQALTMEAANIGAKDDPIPREVPGYAKKLLPAAAIYGANASGKSNVLSAVSWMLSAIRLSHNSWPPGGGTNREFFAWEPHRSSPTLFEIVFLVNDVRYKYGFALNDERFLEEWLYSWPKNRKQLLFSREDNLFRFGSGFSGNSKSLRSLTRPNALFLSTAAQHNHKQLGAVFQCLSKMSSVGAFRYQLTSQSKNTFTLLGIDQLSQDAEMMFASLIRASDLGVSGYQLTDNPRSELDPREPKRQVLVRHENEGRVEWFPMNWESHGVQTVFLLGPIISEIVSQGGIMFIDELESGLHPMLARQIVDMFNDPRTNPRNAQLIFTTHDTNLLGNAMGDRALRGDQVWFTEKDKDGATTLYPLTDYKVREDSNLERGYLQGRYGAIPYLGPLPRLKD